MILFVTTAVKTSNPTNQSLISLIEGIHRGISTIVLLCSMMTFRNNLLLFLEAYKLMFLGAANISLKYQYHAGQVT
jgi:hypothetical protein